MGKTIYRDGKTFTPAGKILSQAENLFHRLKTFALAEKLFYWIEISLERL